MCGICGVVNLNGRPAERTTVEAMVRTLNHRGPDDKGIELDGIVGLGFCRLAILDLSSTGHQPMSTSDRQVWIVFNGEIYNFLELRKEMEKKGYKFRGTSDTEVLLCLYVEHGAAMFSHLNGMFAMAIYDRRKQSILLGRDRLGKKPLFYFHNNNTFAFASELKALRTLPECSEAINPEAVGLYLRLGFVPGWTAIFKSVGKVPAGSCVEISLEPFALHNPVRYWRLPDPDYETACSEEEWLERIEDLLWDATRIRLRSDVPVGVFLSGGIDSGLVAAAAAGQATHRLKSVTVTFPGWKDNEWPQAREVAEYLGLDPVATEVEIGSCDSWQELMAHFDEPFDDSSAIPTDAVSRAAKKVVTVILSGDGGDEVFGGYHNHVRSWTYRHVDLLPLRLRRVIAETLLPLAPKDTRARQLGKRMKYPVAPWGLGGHLNPFADWVRESIVPEYYLSPETIIEEAEHHLKPPHFGSAIDLSQRLDLQLYMCDDILVKVDRMSMRSALEVRSPMLDYRLVELAFRIPPHLRTAGGMNKSILRKIAAKKLPANRVQAPKLGFGVPLRDWLQQKPVANLFREQLNSSPVLRRGAASRLWKQAQTSEAILCATFRLVALGLWQNGRTLI